MSKKHCYHPLTPETLQELTESFEGSRLFYSQLTLASIQNGYLVLKGCGVEIVITGMTPYGSFEGFLNDTTG